MNFYEFLTTVPPGVAYKIDDLLKAERGELVLNPNDISLYCDSDKCKGDRFFGLISKLEKTAINLAPNATQDIFVTYWCRNCQHNYKTFALRITSVEKAYKSGVVTKYGEYPVFGHHVPAKVISLIGPDRELFLKGRRAEQQGLGVGAFAYYRRVVENQKSRLIHEIAKVAQRLGAKQDVLELFNKAEKEIQFSKAVDQIKDVMPESLRIDSHNPMTLLHSALSEGLHAKSDEECLELAGSIRVVLTELAERISIALRDENEIKQAISNLLRRSTKEQEQQE